MYYKILEKVFQQDELFIEKNTVELLDDFIREQTDLGFRYLNPYKFSNLSNITLKKTIQIFLFFTNEDSLFKPQVFIDCPNCTGETIHVQDGDEYLYCEECRDDFTFESLKEKLYIMFTLNDFIEIPDVKKRYTRHNPNSTFDIIQGSSDSLKKDYPLSSNKVNEDKGYNEYPSYAEVEDANILNGKQLSKSMDNLIDSIFSEEVF